MTSAASSQTDSQNPEEMDFKRVRVVEAKPFQTIDLDKLELKIVEVKDEKYYMPLLDKEVPRFILTPSPARVIWGFDMNGHVEQRSFNCGAKANGVESLGIRIELDEAQIKFLEDLDAKMKAAFAPDGSLIWMPLVGKNDKYETLSTKINVALAGAAELLTPITMIVGESIDKGAGWNFLKEHCSDHELRARAAFNGAEAKAVVKLRVWSQNGRAGVSLTATQLAIKVKERVVIQEADVLGAW